MVLRSVEPGARSVIQLKDTRTAAGLGTELGIVMPMTAQARETFSNLEKHGQGDLDHNAAWLDLRRRSGLDSETG